MLSNNNNNKNTRETIEQFTKRGGSIDIIEPGVSNYPTMNRDKKFMPTTGPKPKPKDKNTVIFTNRKY